MTEKWNAKDTEICKKYDDKVKLGNMKYTKIKLNAETDQTYTQLPKSDIKWRKTN